MADTSNDKREERLKKRREADRRRREAETPEKRRARLDRQKAYRQNLKPTIRISSLPTTKTDNCRQQKRERLLSL